MCNKTRCNIKKKCSTLWTVKVVPISTYSNWNVCWVTTSSRSPKCSKPKCVSILQLHSILFTGKNCLKNYEHIVWNSIAQQYQLQLIAFYILKLSVTLLRHQELNFLSGCWCFMGLRKTLYDCKIFHCAKYFI